MTSYNPEGQEPTTPLTNGGDTQHTTPQSASPWSQDGASSSYGTPRQPYVGQPAQAGYSRPDAYPTTPQSASTGYGSQPGYGSDHTASGYTTSGYANPVGDYQSQPGYAGPQSYGASSAFGPTQPTTATAARPQRRTGRKVGAVVGIAALAAFIGGGSAIGAEQYFGSHGTTIIGQPATTVTKVVQGNTSSPDWTVTAANVQKSVVSITVASSQGEAEGSGVVWDNQGDIVTNNHVVAALGSGATIQVAEGDKVFNASVVGTDSSTDLAVIKVQNPTSDLQPIALATQTPTVGEPVMAVGNPLGLSDTVTTGIVSALNRPVTTQAESSSGSGSSSGQGLGSPYGGRYGQSQQSQSQQGGDTSSGQVVTNAIQTSAPINPGNSGGALVDANGELIGINSSIASLSSSSSSSSSESGSIGIGFAIPVTQVKSIATQLISTGSAQHSFLGVSAEDGAATVDGTNELGAKIDQVQSGSPAAGAGLQAGDVVTNINDTPVVSAEALVAQIRSMDVGQQVTLTYVRDGASKKVTVTLVASGK